MRREINCRKEVASSLLPRILLPSYRTLKQSLECAERRNENERRAINDTPRKEQGTQGRIYEEGAGGAHPPPPRDDLQFSNTTGILPKKNLCGLSVLK